MKTPIDRSNNFIHRKRKKAGLVLASASVAPVMMIVGNRKIQIQEQKVASAVY